MKRRESQREKGGRVRGEEKGSKTEKDRRREGAMWAKELFE